MGEFGAKCDAEFGAEFGANGGAAPAVTPRRAPFSLAEQGENGAAAARGTRRGRAAGPEFGAKCGAGFGAEFGAGGGTWDAALVVARLEEAGGVLLALPHAGPSPRLKISRLGAMAEALEGRGRDPLRLPAPSPEAVSRMDEALGWIGLIPQERHVLRRIVGARALVHPLSGRYLHSWRQVGALLGADHKAVQRWHREGVGIIVAALNRTAARAS